MTLSRRYKIHMPFFRHLLFQRLGTILFFSFLYFGASPYASSSEIIVNANVDKSLSLNTLRSIYSMRLKTWDDGTGITVFILDPFGEAHRKFSLEVLGVFPYQLQRIWDVLVFSGTGQAPVVVETEEKMIAKVKSTPGSIGYVIESEVPSNVKKINVN